jgi:hypothetical protein
MLLVAKDWRGIGSVPKRLPALVRLSFAMVQGPRKLARGPGTRMAPPPHPTPRRRPCRGEEPLKIASPFFNGHYLLTGLLPRLPWDQEAI